MMIDNSELAEWLLLISIPRQKLAFNRLRIVSLETPLADKIWI